jgi:hypothetical protein
MSQRDYRSMSHMPSHGNASNTNAGNARESYQHEEADVRENFQMAKGGHPGSPMMRRAGQFMQQQCHFPQPPPNRCYCQPAPFTSLDGRKFFTITNAYGNSKPCPSFY